MNTNIAGTGNTIPATPTIPAISSPASLFGRLMAACAILLSTIMAIPGIGGLLMLAFLAVLLVEDLSKRNFRDVELFLWIGLCVFASIIGFILNISYWRIAFSKRMKTITRKVIWSVSTLFNLALFVGLLILLLTPPRSVAGGWLVLWMCAVFLMGLFSIGGLIEEFRAY